jgi:hypothetical protein
MGLASGASGWLGAWVVPPGAPGPWLTRPVSELPALSTLPQGCIDEGRSGMISLHHTAQSTFSVLYALLSSGVGGDRTAIHTKPID